MAVANIDERGILPKILSNRSGMLLGDKGLIHPTLEAMLAQQNLNLQTPLRRNMPDSRPKKLVSTMMNMRRIVETMIGQLVDLFHIRSIKAKDI